ncbi:hypothetical protein N9L70_06600 [Rhodobacteraceae bacterium]|nr:hypothetical protein [Paracoccaceae bacterium]
MKIDGNIFAQVALQAKNTAHKASAVSHKTSGTKGENAADVILSQELITKNYLKVTASMEAGKSRGASLSKISDSYDNIPKVGLLNANAGPKSGPASVSLELSSIRRDTITMMNELPAEVNIQVADEIRALIAKNEWPTDTKSINEKIKQITNAIQS